MEDEPSAEGDLCPKVRARGSGAPLRALLPFSFVFGALVAGCGERREVTSTGAVFDAREDLRSGAELDLVGAWRAGPGPFAGEAIDPAGSFASGVMKRRFVEAGERVELEAALLVRTDAQPLALYIQRSNATTHTRCVGAEGQSAYEGGAHAVEGRLLATHAPYVVPLPRNERVRCTMVLDQSGSARTPFLSGPPRLLTLEAALREAWHERAANASIIAFLLTIAAYFYVQSRLHRAEHGATVVTGLAVTLAAWLTSFRGLVTPSSPLVAELLERTEFGAIGIAVLFGSYAIAAFREPRLHRPSRRAHRSLVAILSAACLFVPKGALLVTLRLGQVTALTLALADFAVLVRDLRSPSAGPNAPLLVAGFGTPVLLGVLDVALAMWHGPLGIAPLGIVVLVFALAAIHARRAAEARRTIERLAASLERTNQAIGRFVPREFLQALGHADVTGTSLGDAIEREMTVLFADIRGFTTLAERLSPGATFELLNACLARLGPHIRVQGGFIDKYIGDAILALFPGDPAAALRAAVAMQRELGVAAFRPTGRGALAVGVGIHRGRLMMGTIGETERFEATVISDAVNLTARLESLTKQLGCAVLLSDDLATALGPDDRRFLRPLGPVIVKGRLSSVGLVECFEADDDDVRAEKVLTREPLETAWQFLERGQFDDCLATLTSLQQRFPGDRPVAWWVERLSDRGAPFEGAEPVRALVLAEK